MYAVTGLDIRFYWYETIYVVLNSLVISCSYDSGANQFSSKSITGHQSCIQQGQYDGIHQALQQTQHRRRFPTLFQ